jgi:hypothetical protein
MKRQALDTLERKTREWNSRYPVGTKVEYHPVIGKPEYRVRKTRTLAFNLGGDMSVLYLHGESGCIPLDALTVREK